MDNQALGLIEVRGFLGAVIVADTALKTANVELLNAEKIQGGLTTIQLRGDVGAVKVAVAAGAGLAEELGCLISSHVIPRVANEAKAMLWQEPLVKKKVEKLPEAVNFKTAEDSQTLAVEPAESQSSPPKASKKKSKR